MDVATTQTILIIFLSTALLIFLILGIIVAALMIQILRNLRQVSRNAEETSDNIAEISRMIGTKIAPVAISASVAAIMRKFTKRSKN